MKYFVKKFNYMNRCEILKLQNEEAFVCQFFDNVLNDKSLEYEEKRQELSNQISEILSTLTFSEEEIINCFFGLKEEEINDFQILSDKMGMPKIEVYQILMKAFRKIKHPYRREVIYRIINEIEETNESEEYINCQQILNDRLTKYIKDDNIKNNTMLYNIFKRNHIELSLDACSKFPYSTIYDAEPIDVLNFSVRTYNCIKRAGIYTVQELIRMTDEELRHIRNLGNKSLKEIKLKLDEILTKGNGDIKYMSKYKIIKNGVTTFFQIYIDSKEIDDVPNILFNELFDLGEKKNILTGSIKLSSEVKYFLLMQGYIYYEDILNNLEYLNQIINELNITINKDYLVNKYEDYYSEIMPVSKIIYEEIIHKNKDGKISIEEFEKIKKSHDKKLDEILNQIDNHSIKKESKKLIQYDLYNKYVSDISDFYDFSYIQEELNTKDIQIFKSIDYFKEEVDKIVENSSFDEFQDNLDKLMNDSFLFDKKALYEYIKKEIDADYVNEDYD